MDNNWYLPSAFFMVGTLLARPFSDWLYSRQQQQQIRTTLSQQLSQQNWKTAERLIQPARITSSVWCDALLITAYHIHPILFIEQAGVLHVDLEQWRWMKDEQWTLLRPSPHQQAAELAKSINSELRTIGIHMDCRPIILHSQQSELLTEHPTFPIYSIDTLANRDENGRLLTTAEQEDIYQLFS